MDEWLTRQKKEEREKGLGYNLHPLLFLWFTYPYLHFLPSSLFTYGCTTCCAYVSDAIPI